MQPGYTLQIIHTYIQKPIQTYTDTNTHTHKQRNIRINKHDYICE